MRKILLSFLSVFCLAFFAMGQDNHDHSNHDHSSHAGHDHAAHAGHDHAGDDGHGDDAYGHANECGHSEEDIFNPGRVAFHHISDQNIYSIGPWAIPLPCFLKSDQGWDIFSSGRFKADYHGTGEYAWNDYVIYEGSVRRIQNHEAFPNGKVSLGKHSLYAKEMEVDGVKKDIIHLCYKGDEWPCDSKSYADAGFLGGGNTSFYDFSMTKNVVSMILVFFLLGWALIGTARAYARRVGQAPKGVQGFMESIFVFIQDEVAKPFLGPKWEKYIAFLMSIFFFVLGLNLFGQVPFFGGSNVTGNLSFTLVIAFFAFLVTTFSGNKHYWEHIFWMPGIPSWVKVVVTPVEFLGIFIKPVTLMLRLFGNITAGHMVIVIFVGMIFMFGENGRNAGMAWGTGVGSTLLTLFMMAIELLVAFIQAFVFTILTASYIGAAIEDHHHEHEEAH